MGAIKIGESWVSQEAYNYAKLRVQSSDKTDDSGKSGAVSVLNDLKKQYPDVKFSTVTAPFSSDGLNNIAISPKILQEMAADEDARLEYEALIYDVVQTQKNTPVSSGGFHTVAQGTIIDDEGGLRGWGISQSDDSKKSYTEITMEKFDERMKEIRKKSEERKKAAKKEAAKAAKEKTNIQSDNRFNYFV